jgi:Mg2+-importing ATPase
MEAADFFALPTSEQMKAAEDTAVFARTTPQGKLRIIKLLEEKYRVGFLGEGINDAPALKQASVGLVVADATDVARESADIILLKKNLETIVNGIEEGRAIFANSIKYVKATLTSNFGNFYAVGVASLLADFLPMLPIQILLLNLVSDFPMIAIASDNVDPQEIARPHRFDMKEIALFAMALGTISTVFDFIFFALFAPSGPGVLQTNWFIGSVLTELALLFSVRTHRLFWKAAKPSKMVIWLTLGAAVATLVIPFIPLGQEVFRFTRPSLSGIMVIIVITALYFGSTETAKRIFYRITAHHAA